MVHHWKHHRPWGKLTGTSSLKATRAELSAVSSPCCSTAFTRARQVCQERSPAPRSASVPPSGGHLWAGEACQRATTAPAMVRAASVTRDIASTAHANASSLLVSWRPRSRARLVRNSQTRRLAGSQTRRLADEMCAIADPMDLPAGWLAMWVPAAYQNGPRRRWAWM